MGKRAREQIISTVDILQKSVNYVEKALKEKQVQNVNILLDEMQECVTALKNKMIRIYGENLCTVDKLNAFFEQLNSIKKDIHHFPNMDTNCVVLNDMITQIKTLLPKELKKEAVFLPYKASMWDSLESVWIAAKEDKDCIARVIPIPYFDKGADGSMKELHWEGNEFPNYVPITKYDAYDFEEHQPDMIFIHNPYDAYNVVTSVHPDFYSSELKKFTDCLVYIPYFILNETNPNNKIEIENIKHFCLTPGVLHADKVIVQSEDMRQIYVDVLAESSGEQTRSKWEQKIFGIGSPKIDKVLHTKADNSDIPYEWQKVIYKADGNRKKVILYNTSVKSLLAYSEQMLKKIEDVFVIFKENQDEIALLWRPHPLIEATIASMRPKLWEAYQKIVEKYKKEGWGIYDDSSDMNRAVAVSDAYYGDPSSVVSLYKETGKPSMIQYPDILYKSE